ncbi:cobalamin biosynthesis protein CobQ [Leptospira kirschneri serovar Pomona]|uniref:Cobalamin biosynthesis protein CobQ n=1 Tax=Leptospira kirschneri serovar Pomona TaxID=561005 RepID=A0A1T1DXJ6_9LEPT|nr:AAA family ATPase [Leptospira kirschneri]OOV45520.1 cobalamin biosynthesis protein CobQ [Leptospira kirschneri serovar Pomona]
MKKFATASLKGGVGKTTDCIFLSQAFANIGKTVLAIDMDPNNNMTDYFLRNEDVSSLLRNNIGHVLEGEISLKNAIRHTSFNVDIIPSTLLLAKTGRELSYDPGSVLRFKDEIETVKYDYIIVDTPPSLSYEFSTGIYIADFVICPIALTRWTLQSFDTVFSEIQRITKGKLKPIFNVPSMVSKAEYDKLPYLEGYTFTKSYIQLLKEVQKAVIEGRPLNQEEPSWEQFNELAREIG